MGAVWLCLAIPGIAIWPCHSIVMIAASITPENDYQLIGEPCNLMEFVKFKKLMGAYERDDAMDVCVAQVEKRAEVLLINVDPDVIE